MNDLHVYDSTSQLVRSKTRGSQRYPIEPKQQMGNHQWNVFFFNRGNTIVHGKIVVFVGFL